jgi:hypothetical protein
MIHGHFDLPCAATCAGFGAALERSATRLTSPAPSSGLPQLRQFFDFAPLGVWHAGHCLSAPSNSWFAAISVPGGGK